MRALYFNQTLSYRSDYPTPDPPPGEALIRVRLAGICNTDLEILRGYMGFQGVLGHEFVGVVERAPQAPELEGQRVVGEINACCGECATCRRGDPTHCPQRTTLGIDRRDGAMADYVSLPVRLLYPVPPAIPDAWAVFTEPLAAACEILEQVHLRPTDRVVVLGDGKLGLLVAQVLQLTGCRLTVVGRHHRKLAVLDRRGIPVALAGEMAEERQADVVVDCTGSAAGFAQARALVRPRGTLVLKSTFHGSVEIDLSRLVVDEIRLVGSRCGPFKPALRLLEQNLVDVESLIDEQYPLEAGLHAFERAASPGVLKVLLEMRNTRKKISEAG
ncbi:MAG: alcohol dehydrogenase catalytic domain-containing protein [Anaerolineae bacterium]